VNGQTQYTDHPCAGGEKISKDHADNSNRESSARPPDTPTAANHINAAEDRRAQAEERRRAMEAEAAKREADDLWKRRNMSVSCFTQKYNLWVSGRNPRPTPEERDRKIDEVMRECRDLYRIPQDVPPRGTSGAPK
jgi:hypothetical protein